MTTTRRELAPRYDAASVEPALYERWMESGAFTPAPEPPPGADRFVVTQPPPNVTGALHLGHALTATVEDAFVRYHRMRGDDTLWLPGVDHASIAAQFVLDRIIAEEGESRASLGRERYLERMWRFMDETRDVIGEQHRRLGASLDWTRLRFTMDDFSARAVRVAFKRLWDAGLVYRGEALVNWCPRCRTTISDLENIHREETGTLVDGPLSPRARGWDAGPGSVDQRRDHPAGDDPRRHRRRGPPRRRSVSRPRRARGDPAVRRPAAADRRRSVGPARLRHRRGEDHAGARLRRLRARPPPRPADDQRPRRGGADERQRRRVRRAGPIRGPSRDRRTAARDGRPRGRAAARDGHRPLREVRHRRRAAPQRPVVHPHEAAGGAGARIGHRRADPDHPRALREGLRPLDGEHPRLGGRASAVVGPPDPGLVLPGRPRHRLRRGRRTGRLRRVRSPGIGAHPGDRHLRHLVQLRAVAVQHARLARRDPGSPALLPDQRHGDRVRDPLLLGRADDDARPLPDRCRAVPHGLPARDRPRPDGREDEQDEGQRRRSARDDQHDRRGRAPLRPRLRQRARSRPAPHRCEAHRRPELHEQAVERRSLRPRSTPGADGRARVRCDPRRAMDRLAARCRHRASDPAARRPRSRRLHGDGLRGGLERLLRLVPRDGQGRPATRGRDGCGPRRHLARGGRRARHAHAAPPPAHAVRDRGDLAGTRRRRAPSDHGRAAPDPRSVANGRRRPTRRRRRPSRISPRSCARSGTCAPRPERRRAPGFRSIVEASGAGAGDALDAGRPYLEVLAHVRPIERSTDGERPALVAATPLGAAWLGEDSATSETSTERRTARVAELEANIERLRTLLANEAFVSRAPAPVVEQERARLADLEEQLRQLG